jgi:hypothetical protein
MVLSKYLPLSCLENTVQNHAIFLDVIVSNWDRALKRRQKNVLILPISTCFDFSKILQIISLKYRYCFNYKM